MRLSTVTMRRWTGRLVADGTGRGGGAGGHSRAGVDDRRVEMINASLQGLDGPMRETVRALRRSRRPRRRARMALTDARIARDAGPAGGGSRRSGMVIPGTRGEPRLELSPNVSTSMSSPSREPHNTRARGGERTPRRRGSWFESHVAHHSIDRESPRVVGRRGESRLLPPSLNFFGTMLPTLIGAMLSHAPVLDRAVSVGPPSPTRLSDQPHFLEEERGWPGKPLDYSGRRVTVIRGAVPGVPFVPAPSLSAWARHAQAGTPRR